jgi:NADH-quinone oxidoreductase subunit C
MHSELASFLNEKVPGCEAVVKSAEIGDASLYVNPVHILSVCTALKADTYDMNVLQVVSGVDYSDRIEITYVLGSFTKNTELLLKVALPKETKESMPSVDSVCSLWKSANFLERETYDMVGVTFNNHPDHRRLLCPEDWEGYPLRRDYVVQKEYLGMEVDPEHKINNADINFYKELLASAEDPKKVSYSWKTEEA